MKTQIVRLMTLIGAIFTLPTFNTEAQGTFTVVPFAATGLNFAKAPTADVAIYENNLFNAIETGMTQVGANGMPTTFTIAGSTTASLSAVMALSTSEFQMWAGQVNPSSAQYGGSIIIGTHVLGNGTRFIPQTIDFDHVSSDPFGTFWFNSTGSAAFNEYMRGVIYNPDGTKTWVKSGSMVPVNEVIFYEVLSIVVGGEGTPQEKIAQTLTAWGNFNLGTTIRMKGIENGNPFTVSTFSDVNIAIPEPSILALGIMGSIIVSCASLRRKAPG